jgi:hypothetical protein
MKLILASNILEHRGFVDFVTDTSARHPDALFAVTGDLLNVFPEPGEDIRGSISFEIYNEIIEEGLHELIRTQMRKAGESVLLPVLRDMFYPSGIGFYKAKQIARTRYRDFFRKLEKALPFRPLPSFFYIPGNMDYPLEAAAELAQSQSIRQIDCEFLDLAGTKIGALGGIPNSAHPFSGIVEISPYEMHEKEYARRLNMLWGVDVLLTHLSPGESLAIDDFILHSPIKVLICRAPFNFKRDHDFRGPLEVRTCHGKTVINVRPFDYPSNSYFVLDLQNLNSVAHFTWRAQLREPYQDQPTATPRAVPMR